MSSINNTLAALYLEDRRGTIPADGNRRAEQLVKARALNNINLKGRVTGLKADHSPILTGLEALGSGSSPKGAR